MRVYLMRHGESVAPSSEVPDESRWLNAEGRDHVRHVAAHLAEMGVVIDAVVSSPLVRAVQTAELVASIKAAGPFDVSVSAYPEKHPESADFETDLAVLAAKVDAGASRAITQFFFDERDIERILSSSAKFEYIDREEFMNRFYHVS